MRNKMDENEKRQKINLSINNDLNELLEKEMEETGKKKSQVIEKAINLYLDEMNNKELSDMEMRINTEKNITNGNKINRPKY